MAIAGCSDNGSIVAAEPVEILEVAHPIDFPASNAGPNEILETVAAGTELKIESVVHGKDFRAFRVTTANGVTGYVIDDARIEIRLAD